MATASWTDNDDFTDGGRNGEKYILEIHTSDHCMHFKGLFQTIKDLLFDCNIHFDETGMKISELDRSQVGLVHLTLPAENFPVYRCEQPLMLGVSITSLHKYLTHVTQAEHTTVKFLVEENNTHELILEIDSDDDSDTQRFYLKLLDLEMNPASLEGETFNCVFNIPSDRFQRYCRSHALVGDVMEIRTAGDRLELSTEGSDNTSDRTTSVIRANKDESTAIVMANKDDIIAGRFSLKFLGMFAKAQCLAPNVVVYFKNDFPLVLSYKITGLGELKFALCPKVAASGF